MKSHAILFFFITYKVTKFDSFSVNIESVIDCKVHKSCVRPSRTGKFKVWIVQIYYMSRFVSTGARFFAIVLTLSSLNGKTIEWEPLLLNKTSAVFGLLARGIEKEVRKITRRETCRKYSPTQSTVQSENFIAVILPRVGTALTNQGNWQYLKTWKKNREQLTHRDEFWCLKRLRSLKMHTTSRKNHRSLHVGKLKTRPDAF